MSCETTAARRHQLLHELCMLDSPGTRIRMPSDVAPVLMRRYGKKSQEHFVVVTLNAAHELIRIRTITKGLVNRTLVHPREVFRPVLRDNSTAIIIAHNHPSGNTVPSNEDHLITTTIKDAGELLGIRVLDHLIIGRSSYSSFLESGQM